MKELRDDPKPDFEVLPPVRDRPSAEGHRSIGALCKCRIRCRDDAGDDRSSLNGTIPDMASTAFDPDPEPEAMREINP